jgi:hypothetical protein
MKFNNSQKYELEHRQAGNPKGIDLLRFQLKIIRFFGISLPNQISWSGWKHNLFFSTPTLYFLLYVPQICAMFISIYEYWGNIDMITKIVFQIMFAVDALILTLYFKLRGRKLAMLFDMLEVNFFLYIEKVVRPESKHRIVAEASKRCVVMTGILVSIFISVILGWTCLPLILRYADNSVEEDTEGILEQTWKYYCYILWLPNKMLKPSVYKMTYLCQVLTLFVAVGHYTARNVISVFLMFDIATHFKLLVSSLEDMGKEFLEELVEMAEPANRNNLVYYYCTAVSNSKDKVTCIEMVKPRCLKQPQRSQNTHTLGVVPTRAISGSRMSGKENLRNVTEMALIEEKIN